MDVKLFDRLFSAASAAAWPPIPCRSACTNVMSVEPDKAQDLAQVGDL